MADSVFQIECHCCTAGEECTRECHIEHETPHQYVNTVLALPYNYEDLSSAPLREGKSHSIRCVNPNGSIQTRIQGPGVQLCDPPKPIQGSTYVLTVNGREFSGDISKSLISVDNNRNETARSVAQSRKNTDGSIKSIGISVYDSSQEDAILFDYDDGFDLKFKTDKHEPISMHIQVPTVAQSKDRQSVAFARRQIKTKGYDPNTHVALVGQNMRFIVEPLNSLMGIPYGGILKDVEVILQEPAPMIANVQQFICNPLDVDHVNGLVMALEEHIASSVSDSASQASNLFHIIDQHRKDLEKHLCEHPASTFNVDAKVNAAIIDATQVLWQNIGIELSKIKRMTNMYKKGERGADEAEKEFKRLDDKYRSLWEKEQSAGVIKKKFFNVSRQKTKKDLKNMQTALMEAKESKDSNQDRLQAVLDQIKETLQLTKV